MPDPLQPEGRLNVTMAADLRKDLMAISGRDVTVDLGQVTQLGALCMQVLVSAGKTAQRHQTRLQIINVPDHIVAQMSAMGMTPETIVEGRK